MNRYIHIHRESVRHFRRFSTTGREALITLVQPPPNANITEWLEHAMHALYRYVCENTEPDDFIGVSITSDCFRQGPMWISFRLVRDLHVSDIADVFASIAQSNEAFEIDETLRINVHTVSMPRGSGRVELTSESVFKRSILSIRNGDNLCMPRSLVCAHTYAIRGDVRTGQLQTAWNKIRQCNGKLQREKALQLCHAARVVIPETGCGIAEIKLFQEYYACLDVAIIVYSFQGFARGDKPIFDGTDFVNGVGNNVRFTLRIMYYESSRHYQPILNLIAAAGSRGYCIPCNKKVTNQQNHKCPSKCRSCLQSPPCERDQPARHVMCSTCNRSFFDQTCLTNHLKRASFDKNRTVCESLRVCERCCRTVRASDNSSSSPHDCDTIFCKICKLKQPIGHLCFMQPLVSKRQQTLVGTSTAKKHTLYLFYDFETQQSENVSGDADTHLHIVNLCVVQQVCDACLDIADISIPCSICGSVREHVFRDEPIKQLVNYALIRRKNIGEIICIAHNAQGFDAQFVLKHLVARKDFRETPSVILNGSKIIVMKFANLKFLDSLNYLHMGLSALPKAYGLGGGIEKGTFPHLFNTPENQNYVGEMPPVESFSPGSMSVGDRKAFLEWYNERKEQNYVFDFQHEIIKYCKQDVQILRLACLAFRKTFMECGSTDPFLECATIASSCMRVYRKQFLKKFTIGIIPPGGYRRANKQSLKAAQWLTWMEHSTGWSIQHSVNSREKRLPEGPLVDGYCESDGEKIVLQFHGCYWHGCVRCYTAGRDMLCAYGESMDERYERTLRISSKIRQHGYQLIEKWECDFDREYCENAQMSSFIREATRNWHTPLNPRDAFFGGRTGNTVKSYDAQQGEKIKYVDVCSLYPYICKYGRYPIGHPKLYVGEAECARVVGPDNDISRIDGLLMCEVLPPRNLYHPVLPVKMHNKLLFPLCRSCAESMCQRDCNHEEPAERVFVGTWVADELKKAVEFGYVITKIFEIWSYKVTQFDSKTRQGGLFHAYIDKFFAEKTYASGLPPECAAGDDDDAVNRYLQNFEQHEGIKLDKSRIEFNAGLRSVAKLCLNSLWGKFGQRENMKRTEIVREPQRLFELLTSPDKVVNSILPADDETIYVNWLYSDEGECEAEPSPMCNVVVAAYTTALARLKLFSELQPLGERVLYYDTDSIVYVSREGEYEPATGPFLGELTDELAGYGLGTHITSFVSGGPKFYAYKYRKPDGSESCVCKIKGIRLNASTSEKINFDCVRRLVKGEAPPIFVCYDAIRRTMLHDVITRGESKICEPVYSKRYFVSETKSYPYGYISSV